MKSIPAGKLKSRISIQEQGYTETNGSRIPSQWVDATETWASVVAMRGKRRLDYQQLIDAVPYDIKMRYNNEIPFKNCNEGEIKRKYRLVERGQDSILKKIFTIHDVDDDDESGIYKIIAYQKK